MHKKRAEKTQEEAITRNPTKKINKKNKKKTFTKKTARASPPWLFFSSLA
jgi:hypothetical protein